MEPASRVSGTSAPKFPNRCISAHIHAYLCEMRPVSPTTKVLQIGLIRPRSSRMTFLIAMQKVVGSNPISRFNSNPLQNGACGSLLFSCVVHELDRFGETAKPRGCAFRSARWMCVSSSLSSGVSLKDDASRLRTWLRNASPIPRKPLLAVHEFQPRASFRPATLITFRDGLAISMRQFRSHEDALAAVW
jgi:hypothetical protein